MIVTKTAKFDYEFIDIYTAGLALTGVDVKNIRVGKFPLVDAYCVFKGDELFLKDIKLLLNRKELNKLQNNLIKGLTIIPYKIFESKGRFKLELSLARGKKAYDKRETIKKRDIEREIVNHEKNIIRI
jgi:SsrA-binding protein